MKRFLVRSCIFIVILIVTDFCFGVVFDYIRSHARSGDTARTEYICNHTNEDLLIMGSSRAAHHYVPSIIKDTLGLTVYNCGYDGCGIILAYSQLQLILKRYTPQCIVYELTPSFDFVEGDNLRYIKTMRPYYHTGVLDEIIQDVDKSEKIKNVSSFYRYNSSFMTILNDWLRLPETNAQGYKPEHMVAKKEPQKNTDYTDPRNLDNYKIKTLKEFVNLCKQNNILLVVAVSPLYTDDSTASVFNPIFDILKQEGITFLDHSCDSNFNWKRDYFSDSCHLNHEGATEFSKIISSELKQLISKRYE